MYPLPSAPGTPRSSHKAGKWKVVQESLPSKALLPGLGGGWSGGWGCTLGQNDGGGTLEMWFLLKHSWILPAN